MGCAVMLTVFFQERNKAMNSDYEQGLATRKQVMGEEFVAKALAGVSDFTRPIQEHITAKAWGDVWQRPGLDLKTRSLITVAMLTALGNLGLAFLGIQEIDINPMLVGPAGAVAVDATITASGWPIPPIAVENLPAGLTLVDNRDGTARVTGIPTAAGSFTPIVVAENTTGTTRTPWAMARAANGSANR